MVKMDTFLIPPIKARFGSRPTSQGLFVSTDSRTHQEGEAFIALRGENFDAHEFDEQVLERGCPLFVFESNPKRDKIYEGRSQKYPKTLFIGVNKSNQYLIDLAHAHLMWWQNLSPSHQVIALTGTNGKTTTRQMIVHLLTHGTKKCLHSTHKNYNNLIGTPLTLLGLKEEHEICILEIGTNRPGEIQKLSSLCSPHHGLITNIGDGHLELLKNREGVFKEKGALFYKIKERAEGVFLQNMEDPFLATLPSFSGTRTLEKKSTHNKADYLYEFKDQNSVEVEAQGKSYTLRNPLLTGEHNFFDLALAFCLCHALFPENALELTKCTESFLPTENRSFWLERNGIKVFMDAYNANPSSMKASIQGFLSHPEVRGCGPEKVLVILGDMNELGEKSEEFHREVATFAYQQGAREALFLGEKSKVYAEAFPGKSNHAPSFEDLNKEELKSALDGVSFILVKASRSLQLERLLDI